MVRTSGVTKEARIALGPLAMMPSCRQKVKGLATGCTAAAEAAFAALATQCWHGWMACMMHRVVALSM